MDLLNLINFACMAGVGQFSYTSEGAKTKLCSSMMEDGRLTDLTFVRSCQCKCSSKKSVVVESFEARAWFSRVK